MVCVYKTSNKRPPSTCSKEHATRQSITHPRRRSASRRLTLLQGNRHDLLLAPAVPGDIVLLHLDGKQGWAIQKSSFMACDNDVAIRVKMQGLCGACFSGEGMFILKATGQGRLLVNSYGGVVRYDLKPGEVRPRACGAPRLWRSVRSLLQLGPRWEVAVLVVSCQAQTAGTQD